MVGNKGGRVKGWRKKERDEKWQKLEKGEKWTRKGQI